MSTGDTLMKMVSATNWYIVLQFFIVAFRLKAFCTLLTCYLIPVIAYKITVFPNTKDL